MAEFRVDCICPFEWSVYGFGVDNFRRPNMNYPEGFPEFLDSDSKWGSAVVNCYCIHRVLSLMEDVFRTGLCNYPTVRIVGKLCGDIVSYNPCMDSDFHSILEDIDDDNYLKDFDINGDPYLFNEPYSSVQSIDLPDFVSTSLRWTFLIENVTCLNDYRWVVEEIIFNNDLEKWLEEGILKKFNRDLVFYSNMKKNGVR